MGTQEQLLKLYNDLLPDSHDGKVMLYVVPLIRYNYKKSDYLYLLYRDLIENKGDRYKVKSLSVWQHYIFVLKSLVTKSVILHYHWLECTDFKSLSGMIYKLISIFLFKAIGGTLVWTVHNKVPHDKKFRKLNYKIQSWMASKANIIHVHCKSAVDEISLYYNQPASKFRVVDHPSFPSKNVSRELSIERLNYKRDLFLEPDDSIFLMFGNISSYKQIEKVCEIFTDLPPKKKLLIVGPVKKGQMSNFNTIKKIAKNRENILLIPYFIPEDMVPFYMNAADCVVFNYRQILTSGGVELARSFNRPIIAPNNGCLRDINDEHVTLFENQDQLRELLVTFESESQQDA